MKKGFTLVELLAVIVILAIVTLIAVPVVLKQIEQSKKGAAESSCYALLESASNFYTIALTKDKSVDTITFECNGSTCESIYGVLEIRGKVPNSGKLLVGEKGYAEIIEDLKVDSYTCKLEDKKFICE